MSSGHREPGRFSLISRSRRVEGRGRRCAPQWKPSPGKIHEQEETCLQTCGLFGAFSRNLKINLKRPPTLALGAVRGVGPGLTGTGCSRAWGWTRGGGPLQADALAQTGPPLTCCCLGAQSSGSPQEQEQPPGRAGRREAPLSLESLTSCSSPPSAQRLLCGLSHPRAGSIPFRSQREPLWPGGVRGWGWGWLNHCVPSKTCGTTPNCDLIWKQAC